MAHKGKLLPLKFLLFCFYGFFVVVFLVGWFFVWWCCRNRKLFSCSISELGMLLPITEVSVERSFHERTSEFPRWHPINWWRAPPSSTQRTRHTWSTRVSCRSPLGQVLFPAPTVSSSGWVTKARTPSHWAHLGFGKRPLLQTLLVPQCLNKCQN